MEGLYLLNSSWPIHLYRMLMFPSLLEHPRKVTARIYLLRHHLNPDPGHSEYQEQSQPGIPHPLLDTSQSVPTYFPNIPSPSHNPWTNSPNLVIYVHRLLESGYISHSVFLKAYVSLLVGKSALETLSFGEVVRTGLGLRADNQPAEGEATDGRNEALMALQIMGEKSPAAWALEMMNRIIPPLTVWVPKQMCSHLMHGLFSVAYSLHTSMHIRLYLNCSLYSCSSSICNLWDRWSSHLLHQTYDPLESRRVHSGYR